MTDGKERIIVVCGPTASGKSALALRLAEELGGEIVSADSMQIYRRLDIGTAKPTKQEQELVRHHLIDIAEPWENYSVARFVKDAGDAVNGILSAGRLPIICGGTGLYIEAILHPTDYSPEADTDDHLRAELSGKDAHELWLELNGIDPEAAAKTHENNKKRVVRALEIYYTTGRTKTETDRIQKRYEPDHDILLLKTSFGDRAGLYARIDKRVDRMIEDGLAEETRQALLSGDLRPGTTAYQAIGYKELFPYINGQDSLGNCADRLKKATRNYAKRQITWFSRYDGVCVNGYDEARDAASGFLKRS